METDAPADGEANAQTTTTAEAAAPAAPPTESAQDMETSGGEQSNTAALATTSQTSAKAAPIDPDAASYLPECITHTARLLESMFSNHDTCSKFVQQGGVELLLQLYRLPKLPPTFGSSSASHSLLAMFRSLTAHNAPDISTRLQPALASQFQVTLDTAQVSSILEIVNAQHHLPQRLVQQLKSALWSEYKLEDLPDFDVISLYALGRCMVVYSPKVLIVGTHKQPQMHMAV